MSSDIPENNSIYINIGAEKSKFVLILSPSITILKSKMHIIFGEWSTARIAIAQHAIV